MSDEGEPFDVNAKDGYWELLDLSRPPWAFLKYELKRFKRRRGQLVPHELRTGRLLSLKVDYLPFSSRTKTTTVAPETFVPVPPDFKFRNVLVDDTGRLTGIVDWDNITTVPRYAGWASYLPWRMMDWQPFWGEGDRNDSAADYERYREF